MLIFRGAWIDSLSSWVLLCYLAAQESLLHCLGVNNSPCLLSTKFCLKLASCVWPRTASISRLLFSSCSDGSSVLQTDADTDLAPHRPKFLPSQEIVYWEPSAQVAFALVSGASCELLWSPFTSWVLELLPVPSEVRCFSLPCCGSTRFIGCSDQLDSQDAQREAGSLWN